MNVELLFMETWCESCSNKKIRSLKYTVGYVPTFNVQGTNKLAGLGENMDHHLFPVDSMEEKVQ